MRLYSGENTMLLPSADPIVSYIPCYDCKGKGTIESEDEAVEYGGIVLTPVIPCENCGGTGELEIWR